MKTIGYVDRVEGRTLKSFTVEYAPQEVKYTHHERMADAFKEIEGLGNVDIYLIQGRRYRKIATRGY